MHAFGQDQGLLAQENTIFYVGGTPKPTFANCDSFPGEKIDNPVLGNSWVNSSLSLINSSQQLRILNVNCLGLDQDALIDSGSSHNFMSQQVYEQLKKVLKGSNYLEIEQAAGDQLQVVLVDGSSIQSTLRTRIKVNLQNGICVHVECNIVRSLAQKNVLGMPFLQCMNPQIDYNSCMVKFSNGNCIQAVPVAPGEVIPSQQEISAKATVRFARQEGSALWFALIRGPSNVQSGLLASAIGSSDPVVAALPQFQSLFDTYSHVFAEPREPALG